MHKSETNIVEQTLKETSVHQEWKKNYRTAENNKFYIKVFKHLKTSLKIPENARFLDVGCGTGAQSIRLANLGFNVVGIDISNDVIIEAKENAFKLNLQDKIHFQQDSLLELSFPDETFDYILCWGVLMHIPEVEKAISELDRVLKKGGNLIISENNKNSFQNISVTLLKRILGKKTSQYKKTLYGNEYWRDSGAKGHLFVRSLNTKWFKEKFRNNGYIVKKHISGQFSELYIKAKSPLIRKLIHAFNNLWFTYIKIPNLSAGNLFIFEKKK